VKEHYRNIPALYGETEENHRKYQPVMGLRIELGTYQAPVGNIIAWDKNKLL
jgi:hypothetical protein